MSRQTILELKNLDRNYSPLSYRRELQAPLRDHSIDFIGQLGPVKVGSQRVLQSFLTWNHHKSQNTAESTVFVSRETSRKLYEVHFLPLNVQAGLHPNRLSRQTSWRTVLTVPILWGSCACLSSKLTSPRWLVLRLLHMRPVTCLASHIQLH